MKQMPYEQVSSSDVTRLHNGSGELLKARSMLISTIIGRTKNPKNHRSSFRIVKVCATTPPATTPNREAPDHGASAEVCPELPIEGSAVRGAWPRMRSAPPFEREARRGSSGCRDRTRRGGWDRGGGRAYRGSRTAVRRDWPRRGRRRPSRRVESSCREGRCPRRRSARWPDPPDCRSEAALRRRSSSELVHREGARVDRDAAAAPAFRCRSGSPSSRGR